MLEEPYLSSPLRKSFCPPLSDSAAAVVLAAGDSAKKLVKRPAWIRGIDHRTEPHALGQRDLTASPSAKLAAEKAGVGEGKIDLAELARTLRPSRAHSSGGAGPRRGRRREPIGRRAGCQLAHDRRADSIRRSGGPRACGERKPRGRAHDQRGLPAAQPRCRLGGGVMARALRRHRHRSDQASREPARPVDSRPRPRGGAPRPGRRGHDMEGHRLHRHRHRARHVRGRDDAGALALGCTRRGWQADLPCAHGRVGRWLDCRGCLSLGSGGRPREGAHLGFREAERSQRDVGALASDSVSTAARGRGRGLLRAAHSFLHSAC